jgi:tRNA U34 5-carboxymethylaminomethyl modifying GTPase MnmE/TrmE
MANTNDTIAAIATASGIGGIGIVRISGAKSFEIAQKICNKPICPCGGRGKLRRLSAPRESGVVRIPS